MANNQKSLLRQWHMLKHVPRSPAKISVAQLCDHLSREEFPVTTRTVQRDLKELMSVFPLMLDDSDKPFGWSWQRDGAAFSLPGVSMPEALTLKLVEQQLRNQLPPNTFDALKPHFESANRTLSTVGTETPSKAWLEKVRSIAPMQPLLPPPVNEAVRDTIYSALMEDRQLSLTYKKRDSVEATVYQAVHPVAIVQRGGVVYLVCMFADYADVRTLALHRVQQAHARYEPSRKSAGFDLDAYVASGQFGIVTGAPVRLRASFSRQAGEHLFETPLCREQKLVVLADGRLLLDATVPSTRALLWWLLGFGDGVVVLDPTVLGEEIAGMARNMIAAYGGG